MSQYLAQARTALRKIENGESLNKSDISIILNESDITIISIALKQITRAHRTPFLRSRNYFTIGTEQFPAKASGLDFLRTILMHKKNISAFEVYTASQVEPPQAHDVDLEDVMPDLIFPPDSDVGPSCGTSSQRFLDPKAISSLRQYAKELKTHDSIEAVERAQELEHFLRKEELKPYLRKHKKGDKYYIEPGNLEGIVKAFHRKHFFHGTPRTWPKPSQNIADNVRKAVNYAIDEVIPKNPATIYIADHLKNNITTGQVCEYIGDWKWLFWQKD